MAELEERVAKLEREVKTIPEILDLQARVNESRFSALFAELDTIKREVRALPRIVAELLAERGKAG
jgi:chromosome segregation ATPase